jgi:hypothetical protein
MLPGVSGDTASTRGINRLVKAHIRISLARDKADETNCSAFFLDRVVKVYAVVHHRSITVGLDFMDIGAVLSSPLSTATRHMPEAVNFSSD